eukprot:scaffold614_cov255-Pinguiococcus_pyrenoidosus.AAC.1
MLLRPTCKEAVPRGSESSASVAAIAPLHSKVSHTLPRGLPDRCFPAAVESVWVKPTEELHVTAFMQCCR